MEYKIGKKEYYKKNLKIPKGYRLVEDWELLKLTRTESKIRKLLEEGWVWCNTIKGVRAAGLGYVDGFHFYGYYDVNDLGRSRGVFTKIGVDKD